MSNVVIANFQKLVGQFLCGVDASLKREIYYWYAYYVSLVRCLFHSEVKRKITIMNDYRKIDD